MAERGHPEDPNYRGTRYEVALRERYAFCSQYVHGKDVLDVPCGAGWGTSLLEGAKRRTGIDIDSEAIAYAREHVPGVDFRIGSMTALPFQDQSFDVVICLEGLEHIYYGDAPALFREIHRTLRADGIFILTVPLLQDRHHSLNPYHLYEFNQDTLNNLLAIYFEQISGELMNGSEGTEVRFVGKPRIPTLEFSPVVDSDPALLSRTAALFEAETGELTALCRAVVALASIAGLQHWTPEKCAEVSAFIQARQSSQGFFFESPNAERRIELNNQTIATLEGSALALEALQVLGAQAKFPLRFLDQFTQSNTLLEEFLTGLPWQNSGEAGDAVRSLVGCALCAATLGIAPPSAEVNSYWRLIDRIFRWLEASRDPLTGMWGSLQRAPILAQISATAAIVPCFQYFSRPLQSIDRVIDAVIDQLTLDDASSTLTQQRYEAAALLAALARLSIHRCNDVKYLLVRIFWYAWNKHLDENIAWRSYTQLLTLSTIQALFPQDLPLIPALVQGAWPGHGATVLPLAHAATEGANNLGAWSIETSQIALHQWVQAQWEAVYSCAQTHTASLHLEASTHSAPETALVSVVIPTHSLTIYLFEAIESVLRQTLQPSEIIVVDGGPSDAYSRIVIEELRHPLIRVLQLGQLEAGKESGAACNAAIRSARGRYICCLSAENRLSPDFLREALALHRSKPGLGFVTSWYRTFDNAHAGFEPGSVQLPEILLQNSAAGAALFLRSAWESVGGYAEDLPGCEEWDFWIGILATGAGAEVLHKTLLQVRVLPTSQLSVKMQSPAEISTLFGAMLARRPQIFSQHASYLLQSLMLQRATAHTERAQLSTTRETLTRELRTTRHEKSEILTWVKELDKANSWFKAQNAALQSSNTELSKQNALFLANDSGDTERSAKILELNNKLAVLSDEHTRTLLWVQQLESANKWSTEQKNIAEQRALKFENILSGVSKLKWWRLREAVITGPIGFKKVGNITYILASMLVPARLKATVRPWLGLRS